MGFPERLLAIARFVSKGSVVADIGTDHALLPIYLITNHISSRVIAADLNKGPLEAARKNILEAGLSDQITTRLGNGLEVLEPGEVKEIIIAGMGGTTIKSIISSAEVIARPVRKFIFQPMADADLLRIWLSQNGWKIDDEELIKEDGRIYEIMSVSPGQEKTDNKLIISIGPRLYEKKHPLHPRRS